MKDVAKFINNCFMAIGEPICNVMDRFFEEYGEEFLALCALILSAAFIGLLIIIYSLVKS